MYMSERFIIPKDESPLDAEAEASNEWSKLNISDGMDPIDIPPRITKENFTALLSNTPPAGIREIFEKSEDGELELN